LPKEGGFILAANHASSLDPFMVIAAIPRYIRWVVIRGTFAALPRTRKCPKLHPITVRIGPPLFFPEPADKKEDYERLDRENTQKIMQRIAELLY
ncbi:MAG: hypothetical protein KKA80_02770, partial [Candidatus Omnitrophica bacterium]|nr:hypothetical protein [Candidatus Omnitrophota bacterium]